jgi:hypothetical protein
VASGEWRLTATTQGAATSARNGSNGTPILVCCRLLSLCFPSTQHLRTRGLSPHSTTQMAAFSPAKTSPPLAAPATHRYHVPATRRISPSPSCYPSLVLSSSPAVSSVCAPAGALKPKPRVCNYESTILLVSIWSTTSRSLPAFDTLLSDRFVLPLCIRVQDFGAWPRRRRRRRRGGMLHSRWWSRERPRQAKGRNAAWSSRRWNVEPITVFPLRCAAIVPTFSSVSTALNAHSIFAGSNSSIFRWSELNVNLLMWNY